MLSSAVVLQRPKDIREFAAGNVNIFYTLIISVSQNTSVMSSYLKRLKHVNKKSVIINIDCI